MLLCCVQRGMRHGLVEAVAAVAGGLSEADLAAAPSDMPSTSDSGSHTRDITGTEPANFVDAWHDTGHLHALQGILSNLWLLTHGFHCYE